jgi:hypothetical protein
MESRELNGIFCKREIRIIIDLNFKRGLSPPPYFHVMTITFGSDNSSIPIIYKWFHELNPDLVTLEEEERSERPKTSNTLENGSKVRELCKKIPKLWSSRLPNFLALLTPKIIILALTS